MSAPIRVAVVESHTTTREGIVTALNLDDRFEVVASVSDAQAMVDSAAGADVCLLDLHVDDSKENTLQIMSRQPTVVWTDREDWQFRVEAFVLGAWSVLPRGKVHPSSVEEALLHARHREVHLSPQLASAVLDAASRDMFELSAAQLHLLKEIAYGTRLPLAVTRAGLTPDEFLTEREKITTACRSIAPGRLGRLHIVPVAPIREPRFMNSPTERESRILTMLADGYPREVIAKEVGIAPRTVANEVDKALKKIAGVTHASAHERLLLALYYMRRHRNPELLWDVRLRKLAHSDQRIHPGAGRD
ncbi:LuxR C-terminal-related transcriptional regulator [Streptosporangium sp. NPDC004631]